MHVLKMSMNPDYDILRKITRIFDYLNNAHITLYHPTENLAVNSVTMKFKGRVTSR
jgi:hypothetical protein